MSKEEEEYHVDLPTEVLYEIFSRLPTLQPVYRFRCVSKSWNFLLSDSAYIKKIFNSSPWIFMYDPSDEQVQLYLEQCRKFINRHDGLSFKFLLDTDPFKIQKINKVCFLSSSSNGLVLYSAEKPVSYPEEQNNRLFYVCNPLTKQWVSLPPRPQSNGSSSNCSYKIYHCTELVYDSSLGHSTCSYKVVYVDTDYVRFSLHQIINFYIFSSDTGIWKRSEVTILDSAWYGFSEMVFRHGVLYWTSKICRTGDKILIACCLENLEYGGDQCRSIAFPKKGCSSFFGESEGSIYYGIIYDRLNDGQTRYKAFLDVWLLEDDCTNGELNWQMLHESIELKGYRSSLLPEAMYINPVDQNIFILVDRGCCIAYNIRTLTYEVLRGCPIPTEIKYHDSRPILITPKPTVVPYLDVDVDKTVSSTIVMTPKPTVIPVLAVDKTVNSTNTASKQLLQEGHVRKLAKETKVANADSNRFSILGMYADEEYDDI